jgi:hypothetical protein
MEVRLPPVKTSYFPLKGGLNLVTPPLSMPDGMCRNSLNFEVDIDGGYRRVYGYERFDGRSAPSDATYAILECTFSSTVTAGQTITGLTSAATGVVIAVTSTYIAFTKATGTFQSGESIQVGGVTKATSTAAPVTGGASTALLNAQYTNLAADQYRADIAAVPGSGDILGVHRYSNNSKIYAFRNNAGGTAAEMYGSSTSGWVKVELGFELAFTSGGTTEIADGDTITGATSGATAVVARVVLESGSWAAGTAAGRFIFASQTGTFQAENIDVGASLNLATIAGNSSAITLAPSGRYECINHNFGGLAGSTKMYGVSGVHRAFEFDGTTFVPIRTGMTVDAPTHIAAHVNHLFLAFAGSLQHSGPGAPYAYTIVSGAGELAMGDTITGMLSLVGSQTTASLAVFTANKTSVLYGTSSADWTLVTYSFEAGGFEYTMQNIGAGYVLDALGIKQIIATDAFGNFSDAQASRLIRPFIEDRVGRSVGSCISRLRNQYRVLFNDRYALHLTFDNGKLLGCMPIQHGHTMTCVASFESATGEEFIFSGGTDGYVYRMEKGTSFDGEDIIAYLNLSFSFQKNPRLRKRYRKAVYEVSGGSYAEMDATYELGYGSSEIDQGVISDISTPFGSVNWDTFVWDSFFWDGRTLLPAEQDLTGTAENISLILRSTADYFRPFTVNSAIIHYTDRRLLR